MRGHATGFADLKTIEAAKFAEALAEGRMPEPSFDDALAVARIIQAVPEERWVEVAREAVRA